MDFGIETLVDATSNMVPTSSIYIWVKLSVVSTAVFFDGDREGGVVGEQNIGGRDQ